MNCRVCRHTVTGANSDPVAIITPRAYVLMVNCPDCSASLAFVMWLSEEEALQRADEERQYQAHRAALSALSEARRSGASWSVLRRLEAAEEVAAYAE